MATTYTDEKYRAGQNYVYRVLATHKQGDDWVFTYKVTPPTGVSVDLPTAATLRVTDDATYETDPLYSNSTATITDGTTYYTVSFTVPAATTADWVGLYYFEVKETLTSGIIQTKIQDGRLTVRKDIPNG